MARSQDSGRLCILVPLLAGAGALIAPGCSGQSSGGNGDKDKGDTTNLAADEGPRIPTATVEELNVPTSDDPDSPFASEVFRSGLLAFRRANPKGACASCHSPDAFDLAFFNYSDGTIMRRAFGVDASIEDAHAIVELVHYQRERHGLQPVDPTKYAPLQPGGQTLPGETVWEREQAFWDQLVEIGHPFTSGRIDSPEEAHAALETIAGYDLRSVKVGFDFPRWTDDKIRGHKHHSANDWIPELPSFPKEGMVEQWYELQNEYIQSPTPEALWAMYDQRHELTDDLNLYPYKTEKHDGSSLHDTFGRDMFGSVLIAQHMLRGKTLSRPDSGYHEIESHDTPFKTNDPFVKEWRDKIKERTTRFWNVGASMGSGGHPYPGDIEQWPEFIVDKDTAFLDDDKKDGRTRIARSWFWMGYMFDPFLKYTASRNRGEYFPAHLHRDGHLIHSAFANSTMAATLIYGRDNRWHRQSWHFDNGDAAAMFGGGMSGFGWIHNTHHLTPKVGHSYDEYPADLADLLRLFQLNDYRARIYAAIGSLEAGYKVSLKDKRLAELDDYEQFLTEWEDEDKLDELGAAISKLRKLIKASEEVGERAVVAEDKSDRSHVGRTEGEEHHLDLGIPEDAYAPRPESPVGDLYELKCAGCHGLEGEGRGLGGELAGHENEQTGYPPLAGYQSYEDFERYVRQGSEQPLIPMPWFDDSQISDEELKAIFEALNAL